MIKILHILSNLSIRSGVTTVLFNYASHLDRNNISFSILYYDQVDGKTYLDRFEKLGIKCNYIGRKHFLRNLNSFCKKNKNLYDIFQVHEPFIAPALLTIRRKLGVKKVVFYSHSTRFSDTKVKNIRNMALAFPSRFIGDCFFACSEKAGTKAFGKTFSKKGFVINNAFEQEKFLYCESKRKEIRSSLGVQGKTVIGHVGNMTPPKNHLFLLDVFKEYLYLDNNSVLLLIGTGYLKEKIVQKSISLNIFDKVIFVGLVDDVHFYLSAMDYFVFPSLFEGLGLAFVEAQVNGLKCLVSDVVPKEANINQTNNILASLRDGPKKWAFQLKKLSGRVSSQISDNGFNIEYACKQLEKLYFEILEYEKE